MEARKWNHRRRFKAIPTRPRLNMHFGSKPHLPIAAQKVMGLVDGLQVAGQQILVRGTKRQIQEL